MLQVATVLVSALLYRHDKYSHRVGSVGAPLAGARNQGTRKGCPYEVLLVMISIDKCKDENPFHNSDFVPSAYVNFFSKSKSIF